MAIETTPRVPTHDTRPRVLLVDDDVNVLAMFKRLLRKEYHIETASGAQEAIEWLTAREPFAVLVSDMYMEGLSGVDLLSEARKRAPDTVRIMISGHANLTAALDAVNEGNVFRFLVKPCPPKTLRAAIDDGVTQFRLIVAERELIERTLQGAIEVLFEMLELSNPEAGSRAARIRRYVRHAVAELSVREPWQFELAALLSQIGCITLPSYLFASLYGGEELSRNERQMYQDHPMVAYRLLSKIPRLESVALMIKGQHLSYEESEIESYMCDSAQIRLGTQILRVCTDLDRLVMSGLTEKGALAKMRRNVKTYNPLVLAAMETFALTQQVSRGRIAHISADELTLDMVAAEDILARNGSLLLTKGQRVTYPAYVLVRNYARDVGVMEPFRVLILNSA